MFFGELYCHDRDLSFRHDYNRKPYFRRLTALLPVVIMTVDNRPGISEDRNFLYFSSWHSGTVVNVFIGYTIFICISRFISLINVVFIFKPYIYRYDTALKIQHYDEYYIKSSLSPASLIGCLGTTSSPCIREWNCSVLSSCSSELDRGHENWPSSTRL